MTPNSSKLYLYHRQHGTGDRDVVFIHGNLGSADWWTLVERRLPAGVRGTFLDLRGCGRSDKPEPEPGYRNYSFPAMAGDVLGLLDDLGIRDCVLAAHATGALVALHAISLAPNRFRGLLALDPAGPRGVDLTASMHLFQRARNDPNAAFALISSTMPTIFEPTELESASRPKYLPSATTEQRDLIEHLAAQRHMASDGAWFGYARNLTREHAIRPLLNRLPEFGLPVWIVWGDKNMWIKIEDMEEIDRLLPCSQLIVVPGRGGSLQVEDPERFVDILTSFVTEERL